MRKILWWEWSLFPFQNFENPKASLTARDTLTWWTGCTDTKQLQIHLPMLLRTWLLRYCRGFWMFIHHHQQLRRIPPFFTAVKDAIRIFRTIIFPQHCNIIHFHRSKVTWINVSFQLHQSTNFQCLSCGDARWTNKGDLWNSGWWGLTSHGAVATATFGVGCCQSHILHVENRGNHVQSLICLSPLVLGYIGLDIYSHSPAGLCNWTSNLKNWPTYINGWRIVINPNAFFGKDFWINPNSSQQPCYPSDPSLTPPEFDRCHRFPKS